MWSCQRITNAISYIYFVKYEYMKIILCELRINMSEIALAIYCSRK